MRLTALLLAQVALSVATGQFGRVDVAINEETLDRTLLVRLPCADCPGSDEKAIEMAFKFQVSALDPTTLSINGHNVLPASIDEGLTAAMIPRDADVAQYLENPTLFPEHPLDYSLITKQAVTETDPGLEQDILELSVFGVEGKPVTVDSIGVRVFKDESGLVMIDRVWQAAPKAECQTVSCILHSMFEKMAAPVRKFRKPCPGKGRKMGHKMGHGNPVAEALEGVDMDAFHHPHHGHHRGPGGPMRGPGPIRHGHHRPHMHNSFIGMIFIPILCGLAVGIATFAVGMFVGHLIRFVVCKVRGKKMQCSRARRNRDVEAGDKEAALGLLAEEEVEAPPAYKDDSTAVAVEKE